MNISSLITSITIILSLAEARLFCRKRPKTTSTEAITSTTTESTSLSQSATATSSSTTASDVSMTLTATEPTTAPTQQPTTPIPEGQQGAIDVKDNLSSNAVSGKASYYTFWNQSPGFCGEIAKGPYIVAMCPGMVECGRCVLVEHNGKRLKAEITDQCAGCEATKIDLSDRAFEYLAPLEKGIIDIKWEVVDC